tara:strand:- start:127 stop:456 length:330 start_codon:yes stop_codon:yes gene_type:complete
VNVQISLTVELDEVPLKTAELLDERVAPAIKHIGFLQAAVINNLHNGKEPSAAMLKEIDSCRKTLYLLDARLEESEKFLSGWLQHKIAPKTEKQLLVENTTGGNKSEEG